MTKRTPVVAVANLKGGVGKSTTTLMLAEGLALQYGLNVLIFDFDAQANLSELLLTSEGVQREHNQDRGVAAILDTFVPGKNRSVEDLRIVVEQWNSCCIEELVRKKNRDSEEGWISLLAADPSMRFLEPFLERSPGQGWYDIGEELIWALEEATQFERSQADIILIDCPPHVSTLCRSALKMADYYVTPTLAETLSIWGLQQFTRWMTHTDQTPWFSKPGPSFNERQFVVCTRFSATSRSHQKALEDLKRDWSDRTFSSPIGARVSLNRELPRRTINSLHSFGSRYRGKLKSDVMTLADEFVGFIHSREPHISWSRSSTAGGLFN